MTTTKTLSPHNTAELLHFQDDDLMFYEEFKTVTYEDALHLAEFELADMNASVIEMNKAGEIVIFKYSISDGTAVLTLNPGFGASLSIYNQKRAVEIFWHN